MTKAGNADVPGARITLNEDGISIVVEGKAGLRITKQSEILLTDGTNKAKLAQGAWDFNVQQVAFNNAQKITLG
jgi:hypothetical protein